MTTVASLPLRRAIAFLRDRGWRCVDSEDAKGYFEPIDASAYFSFDSLANVAAILTHELRRIPGIGAICREDPDEQEICIVIWPSIDAPEIRASA